MHLRIAIAGAAVLLAACGPPATELVLVVNAESALAERIATLELAGLSEPTCARWPRVFALSPSDPDALELELSVIARELGGREIARAELRGSYDRESVGVKRLRLDDSCTPCTIDLATLPLESVPSNLYSLPGANEDAPAVGILFPPHGSVMLGSSLVVTATAGSYDGIESVEIAGRRVELERCVRAAATIDLSALQGTIEAVAVERGGLESRATTRASFVEAPIEAGPFSFVHSGTTAYYLMAKSLRKVRSADGAILSETPWPKGAPRELIDGDRPGTFFALRGGSVWRVYRGSLFEELVSRAPPGDDDVFQSPRELYYDAPRARLLLLTGVLSGSIFDIDIATGERRKIFEQSIFAAGDLTVAGDRVFVASASGYLVELGATRIEHRCTNISERQAQRIVAESAGIILAFDPDHGLYRHELDTGLCTELGGSGASFLEPESIVLSSSTAWLPEPKLGTVIRVDLNTGERTQHRRFEVSSGPGLGSPADCAYSEARREVIAVSETRDLLTAMRAQDGARRLISGTGDRMSGLRGLALAPDGRSAVALATNPAMLYRVDLASGERTEVALDLRSPDAVVYKDERTVFVLYAYDPKSIAEVDLLSGAKRTIFSGDVRLGAGAIDMAYDRARGRLLVTDGREVFFVELDTGAANRLFTLPNAATRSIDVDPSGRRALVIGGKNLVMLDLETLAIEVLAGRGMPFEDATSLCVDWARDLAYVGDTGLDAFFLSDLTHGQTVIMSR